MLDIQQRFTAKFVGWDAKAQAILMSLLLYARERPEICRSVEDSVRPRKKNRALNLFPCGHLNEK